MSIGDRIRIVRAEINQEDFGKRIGVSKPTISSYETGSREVTDRAINDICREFGVDSHWLKTGEGEPFLNHDDDLDRVIDALLVDEKETAKAVFKALAKMGGKEWEMLKNLILSTAHELERAEQKKE